MLLAFVCARGQSGIRFNNALKWSEILAKAKMEHKYIFIDCFATWCGPCKQMDKDVYSLDTLGAFFNTNFISVKLQMDSTKKDDDAVKAWYPIANQFSNEYEVHAFPTFLFFDENGLAVHKAVGFEKAVKFKKTALDAIAHKKQFYTLKRAFDADKLDFAEMPVLAKAAKIADEAAFSEKVAATYIHDYLDTLNEAAYLTRDNIDFIGAYPQLIKSDGRLFTLCFAKPVKVDAVLHSKDYAERVINQVIYLQEFTPKLSEAKASKKEPDWNALTEKVNKKFGNLYTADMLITAKINWYKEQKDGKNYTHYLTISTDNNLKKDGITNIIQASVGYNNVSWTIFQFDTDPKDLNTALVWEDAVSKFIGKPDANTMDTKANLLYKLGKKEEAIALETQAAQLKPKDKEIAEALKKMQANLPTWPDKMP